MGMEGLVRLLQHCNYQNLNTIVCMQSCVVHLPSGSWSPGSFFYLCEVWVDYKHKKNCLLVT